MKIVDVKELEIPEVKIITYQRFRDERGYFTETYRKSDFANNPQTPFLKDIDFTQVNESFSNKGAVRGLHFQWDPFMAKMLRVIYGNVIDVALDIRPTSETFGKIVGYEFQSSQDDENNQWIWIPVGFAHGVYFLKDSLIEYFCTGQWAPDTEQGISPLAGDIDWSVFDKNIKAKIDHLIGENAVLNEKDKKGLTLEQWKNSEDSKNFIS